MMDKMYAEKIIAEAEKEAEENFKTAGEIALYNQEKVLNAFQNNRVNCNHFNPSDGYGYDDIGREVLNKLYAEVFGGEDAIVSPLITGGTHALSSALFGVLRPGDLLLSIAGKPYDTLDAVINGKNNGSLKDFGIEYAQVDLLKNEDFDLARIAEALKLTPKVIFIQRSKGYLWRKAFSIEKIGKIIDFIRENATNEPVVLIDNCYGEFVEKLEPSEVGADLTVGSLIKNPGGGIAPTGGYIVGKRELVKQISYRLTAPSLGTEVGSYSYGYRLFYQGLFMAPSVVKNAVFGNILAGYVLNKIGFETLPKPGEMPRDIIKSIKFKTPEELIAFCQTIQRLSPVDSYVTPEPWDMPGYDHKVIMAAGTFVQGASSELTADGTIREPYVAYMQGGLTYEHCKLALLKILTEL